jgi:hypothetical protein
MKRPILLALYIVAIHWNTLFIPLMRDEGEYAYSAQLLLSGHTPYTESFLQKPPMIIYTYCLGDARIVMIISHFLAALLMSNTCSMFLLPTLLLMPRLGQCSANVEQFMILPIVLMYVLVKRRDTTLMLGGLAAITILYKYTAIPIVFCILLQRRYSWKEFLELSSSFSITSFAILRPFLGDDKLLDCTYYFNQAYVASHHLKFVYFEQNVEAILFTYWMAVLFGCLSPSYLILVALFCTAASPYSHYYLLAIPFIAISAGNGVEKFLAYLEHRGLEKSKYTRPLITLVLVIGSLYQSWDLLIEPNVAPKLYGDQPFIEAKEVAFKVKSLTSPNDKILIMGSEPEILYYSGRFSATRFDIMYPLFLDTNLKEKYQIEAIENLETPEVIVEVHSWFSMQGCGKFSEYVEELKNDYELVSETKQFSIYKRK